MQAEAIMTAPVIGIEPTASISDAAGLMLSRKISGLPVIRSDGTLVGVVSEGDFLRRGELGTKRNRSRWLEFLVRETKRAYSSYARLLLLIQHHRQTTTNKTSYTR